ncbi:MAG: hypothetical protein ACFFDT_25390, partial [Candidatus Hodarchaeota archaeon]
RYKTCRCELSIVARHAAVRDRSAATIDTTTYPDPRNQSEICFFVFKKISARSDCESVVLAGYAYL